MIKGSASMTRDEWVRVCGARLQVHGITNFSPLEIADVGRQSSGYHYQVLHWGYSVMHLSL